MKVTIDRDNCISCAACWEACPAVFEESPDDGFSRIVVPYQAGRDPGLGEVPEDLRGCAQEAADACPVEIIHLD